MNINTELKKMEEIIDKALRDALSNRYTYQDKIFDSMEYSLFTGGKRLRPIMTLKACELFGGNIYKALPFALAIEMIHTYSLVHDDLPSMDNDDFRRGKPTNHKVFGEAMAILTGDALLNLAFEVMSSHILKTSDSLDSFKRNTQAMEEISHYSGVGGMIGGQVIDLFVSHENMSEDKLLYMYKTKTAALIQASLVSGAIIGGAQNEEIESIRNFGLYLGLAYQIRDDILDKSKDSIINKPTYLNYHSFEKAEKDIVELSHKAIEVLESLDNKDTEFFMELTKVLIDRNS